MPAPAAPKPAYLEPYLHLLTLLVLCIDHSNFIPQTRFSRSSAPCCTYKLTPQRIWKLPMMDLMSRITGLACRTEPAAATDVDTSMTLKLTTARVSMLSARSTHVAHRSRYSTPYDILKDCTGSQMTCVDRSDTARRKVC